MTGRDRRGDRFSQVLFGSGGMGAGAGRDGLNATAFPTNSGSGSVEAYESSRPVVMWRKDLLADTSGTIKMFGSDPYHAVKSGRVGAMLQSGGLMPEVTVRELVELITKLHPDPEPVATTMKRAGIAQFADQRVDKLSGGQTQRVRFALAICGKSELIVLDEPTAAMDVETRRLFWNSMKEEVAAGRTLLFATHYLEEADQAADRILVINRGRLLADGTPAELKARAGARRLSFRLDRVDEPFLLGLPGLVNLDVRHDVVQIQTSDSDATLYAVLDAGYRPSEIEVTSLGLEQAFIAITAEDDATNGTTHAGETN